MKVKIYYHHTDAGGVVYYANYLKFLEEARTEFFQEKGLSVKELSDNGVLFVVCRQEIDYRLPAHYGDTLSVQTSIDKATGVKLEFMHEISNQSGQLVCQAKTIMVCVDRDIRPQPIPPPVREKLLSKPS